MLSRLAASVLMAASMLPSGWVFCVQAGGNIEVEYSTGLCCAIAQPIAGEAVTASSIDACDGCQDIAIECSAHRKERFESAAAISTAVCSSPLICPDSRVDSSPLGPPTIPASPTLSRLSSVIIRC